MTNRRLRINGITPRFDEYVASLGETPVEHDLEPPTMMQASGDLATVMGLEAGASVLCRSRQQGANGTVYRLVENYYPLSVMTTKMFIDMHNDERYDALVAIKAESGLVITEAQETVTCRLPTTREQALFGIDRHTPVLSVLRVCRTGGEQSRVLLVSAITYVASRVELVYDYPVTHWSMKEEETHGK